MLKHSLTCQFFSDEIIRNYFFYFSKKIRFTRVLLIISRIQTMDVKLVSKLPFVFSFIFCLCMSLLHCVSFITIAFFSLQSLALFIWQYYGFSFCVLIIVFKRALDWALWYRSSNCVIVKRTCVVIRLTWVESQLFCLGRMALGHCTSQSFNRESVTTLGCFWLMTTVFDSSLSVIILTRVFCFRWYYHPYMITSLYITNYYL